MLKERIIENHKKLLLSEEIRKISSEKFAVSFIEELQTMCSNTIYPVYYGNRVEYRFDKVDNWRKQEPVIHWNIHESEYSVALGVAITSWQPQDIWGFSYEKIYENLGNIKDMVQEQVSYPVQAVIQGLLDYGFEKARYYCYYSDTEYKEIINVIVLEKALSQKISMYVKLHTYLEWL